MDQEVVKVIMGVFCLLIIINATVIISVGSADPGQNSTIKADKATGSGKAGATKVPVTTIIPKAVIKPPKTPVPTPTPVITPEPTPESFIEIVTPEPELPEIHPNVQPDLWIRSEEGYDTLYSLTDQKVSEQMPAIVVNVVNPPVILDYVFMPDQVMDVKPLDYKIIRTEFHENYSFTRPYENAWFMVNITDVDNGEVIEQEGTGRNFGLINEKQIVIENSGKVSFDLKGNYGNVTLSLKMRKPSP
jgi:hypothetical protein